MKHEDMIQEWRDRLGYSEWEIRATLDGYGADDEAAHALLDAFLKVCPEAGPAVGMDGRHLSVTFGFAARTAEQASGLAEAAFVEAAVESGLEPVAYAYEIKAVDAEVTDDEAVPA